MDNCCFYTNLRKGLKKHYAEMLRKFGLCNYIFKEDYKEFSQKSGIDFEGIL